MFFLWTNWRIYCILCTWHLHTKRQLPYLIQVSGVSCYNCDICRALTDSLLLILFFIALCACLTVMDSTSLISIFTHSLFNFIFLAVENTMDTKM